MRPLVDADILLYEIGFSGQFKDEEEKEILLDFDHVASILHDKIDLICEEAEATEQPVLYLTGDEFVIRKYNELHPLQEPLVYKPNFRHAMAVTKVYKGTRKSEKPFHFKNLVVYILANFNCVVATGIEADDQMCIDQTYDEFHIDLYGLDYKGDNVGTIICSRDKDLRMCPGWHYSWECGKQWAKGPTFVRGTGWLEEANDGKITGYGDMFFYYQMLVGDAVDNIPGLKGCGIKKAYPLLENIKGTRNMYETVRDLYKEKMGGDWKEYLQEQANLLWMVRELDKNGEPVMFKPPREEDNG